MARHGGTQHYLRPDFTYKTSVLQPVAGYSPVADAEAVAGEFVGNVGLAGPVAMVRYPHAGYRGVSGPVASWWNRLKARVRANMMMNSIKRQAGGGTMPAAAFAAAAPKVDVDTSPRPPAPSPTAIPTTGGWMPEPQSPRSAVAYTGAQGDPPTAGAVAAAVAADPKGAAFPAEFWADVIGRDLPPLIAARAENDVLRRFFRRKADRAQGAWPPPASGWR